MTVRVPDVLQADLPKPEEDALAHSAGLVDLLRGEIDSAGGSIGFRRFMEAALHEPGLGYYSAGPRKFGAAGDFVTAPELSSLFSECVANQCAELLERSGGGTLLELGAGTGAMACVLVRRLAAAGLLGEYWILETSADLRERQRGRLASEVPELLQRVRWLEGLPASGWRGVIVANEVIDCLPVHRVLFDHRRIREQRVCWTGRDFAWTDSPADAALESAVRRAVPEHSTLPDRYCTEINTGLDQWIAGLASHLEAGAMLFIDYGYTRHEYYHPQRSAGTLLCHYRHRVHDDPFLYPGLQDITAAVDFSAVAAAGAAAGLEPAGYTTQAHFLAGCGLPELLARSEPRDEGEAMSLRGQARMLVLPGEMGEQVKVLALSRGRLGVLRGFSLADHRPRLRLGP